MNAAPTFGPWLKQRRQSLDMTQKELAHQAGCSTAMIKKIEADVFAPSRQLAELLARALQIPSAELDAFIAFARPNRPAVPALPTTSIPRPSDSKPEASRMQLPVQMTELIGRKQEIDTVCEILSRPFVRLLTLVGPPGIGKTRLSLAVAQALQPHFADGVYFVPLANIADPLHVPAAIGQALGIRESPQVSLMGAVQAFLEPKALVLILDNIEHVLAAAPTLAELLASAPGLKLITTSREVLRLYGEHEFAVPPLDTPDADGLPTISALEEYSAIRLFVQRSQAHTPHFQLTPENADAIARLCGRLDGMPLAIEMAAAQTKWFSPTVLERQHSQHLNLLTMQFQGVPARQQTLRAAIDWSYDALDPELQAIFGHVSVFTGGAAISAIASVCNKSADTLVVALQTLADKQLLRCEQDANGETRFGQLFTLREYGQEKIHAHGTLTEAQARHAHYFMNLAEQAEDGLKGDQQGWWIRQLDTDIHNLRSAIQWGLGYGHATLALRISAALYDFWLQRSYFSEGRRWLEQALETADAADVPLRAKGLRSLGMLEVWQGDYERGNHSLDASLALYVSMDDHVGQATVSNGLAILLMQQGQHDAAHQMFERSIELHRQAVKPDPTGHSNVLNNLGVLCERLGYYDAAASHYEASLAIRRQIGSQRTIAGLLINLGVLAENRGAYTTAWQLYIESRDLLEQFSDVQVLAVCLGNLGNLAMQQGDYAEARRQYEAARALVERANNRPGLGIVYIHMSYLAIYQERWWEAAQILEQAHQLYTTIGHGEGLRQVEFNRCRLAAAQGHYGHAWKILRTIAMQEQPTHTRRDLIDLAEMGAVILHHTDRYRDKAAHFWSAACTARQAWTITMTPGMRAWFDRYWSQLTKPPLERLSSEPAAPLETLVPVLLLQVTVDEV